MATNKTTFTALPLYTDRKGFNPVEIPKENWFDYTKRMLGIDTADLPCIEINGHKFDVLCDDEGLLCDDPVFTVYQKELNPLFAGNVLIMHLAKVDEEGESILEDLTRDEIDTLRLHSKLIVEFSSDSKDGLTLIERTVLTGAVQI